MLRGVQKKETNHVLTILQMIKLLASGRPTCPPPPKKKNPRILFMFNLASFSCLITCLENHHKDLARNNQIAGSAAKTDQRIDKTCEESYYLGESVVVGNGTKTNQKCGKSSSHHWLLEGIFHMGVSKK